GAGFYFYVSPKEAGVAGGLYQPSPDDLLTVRRMIVENADSFRKLFENRRIKKLFGGLEGVALTPPPKGFDAEHPAIDLLKRKSFVLHARLDPGIATTPKLYREIVTRIEALAPFISYLNSPLVEKTRKQKREEAFLY